MRLDPISSKIAAEIKKVESARKTKDTERGRAVPKSDTSHISSDAKRLSDTKANTEIVSTQIDNTPDIRQEKIDDVQKKIKSGYYNSPEFIDKFAEKMLSVFGISE